MNNEIELKFERFTSTGDYYVPYYRPKNFTPQEILPKTFFEKLNKKLFGKSKYTQNEWKPIMNFAYGWHDKWIHIGYHPNKFWQNELVKYDEIESYKRKFKTIEDVDKFESKEREHLNKMIKDFNEQNKKLVDVIV